MQYARALVNQQKLDRVVIDECHLTVTAVEYRPKVVDLTNICSLRTQFVHLNATLPPCIQREFEERNHLLRPVTIRVSSNRSNMFYMVRKVDGRNGSLLEQAAAEVEDAWIKSDLFEHSRDKIILYVRTREEAKGLSGLLQCDSYTSESGTAVEKKHILTTWVASTERPYIVGTTALAEGFDYPHVRLVVDVNEPESLVIFAQESGRAGRDGLKAYSLVLLAPTWKPQGEGEGSLEIQMSISSRFDVGLRKEQDRHAVHQYLRGELCYRTPLTEHLDSVQHRRWCMSEDVPCDVCRDTHQDIIAPREVVERKQEHTGLSLIQQDRLRAFSELARYREDLAGVQGTCLLCREKEEAWDHPFSQCQGRHGGIQERNKAQQRNKAKGKQWLQPFTGCFWCLNPQSVCQRAGLRSAGDQGRCEHSDIVLPLCCGLFDGVGSALWLRKHFDREFASTTSYFDWLGEEVVFADGKAVQAVRVAAGLLAQFRVS